MPTAIVLRFVPFENLDGFAAPFLSSSLTVKTYDAWHPQAVEWAESADVLVVMGGPLGVGDIEDYPYLSDIILMLRERLEIGLPTLGICLGAQLMARALGANIHRAPDPEIGVQPLVLTAEGHGSPVECFADEPLAWHWHQDYFELPAGTQCLARSAHTEVQAFSRGPHILACQFHPEFSGDVEAWLVGHTSELRQAGVDIPKLRNSVAECRDEFQRKAALVAQRWLQGLALSPKAENP